MCESKSYWGYSESFLNKFMKDWRLTQDYIEKYKVMGHFDNNEWVAFFSFSDKEEPMLDNFFLKPTHIGRGIRSIMWQEAIRHIRHQNWKSFQLIADPNAELFYLKMGAFITSNLETYPGRIVPVMTYCLESNRKQAWKIQHPSQYQNQNKILDELFRLYSYVYQLFSIKRALLIIKKNN